MPSRVNSRGVVAKFAKSPKRYSVFSSGPSKVRVISTRPWTLAARREELMDLACGGSSIGRLRGVTGGSLPVRHCSEL